MSRLAHLKVVQEPVVELETRRQKRNEPLLRKSDIAEKFGFSTRTVERWVDRGMPVAERTWAGYPLFRLSDCLEWHRSFHQ